MAYQVKRALYSTARMGPEVRIKMPYNNFLFSSGLALSGYKIKDVRGHAVYGIRH